jgi:aspartate aminotransferase
MPSVSKRGQRAYTSAIRKLSPFADKAKQKGRFVYHLNIGQPDILSAPTGVAAVKAANIDLIAYSPSRGNASLRQKLTEYYARFAINVSSDDILITTGGSEAIFFTVMACLDRGAEILIPEPFYAIYNGFTEVAGVKIKTLTSHIETGFALPEIEEFERAITKKTRGIFLCNPNNPTGSLYSEADLRQLAKIVKKYDLFLFVDEVYREFCYDGQEFFSALRLEDIEQNVVIIDSISKRFSATGARVGAMVTRNKEIITNATKYAEYRLSPPTLGQIFAEAAIDVSPAYMKDVKAEYCKRRDVIVSRLQKIEGVICNTPGGAFYAIAKLPVEDTEKFCRWLLEKFHHNNRTVMLAPAAGFYSTKGLGKQEVRLAYVLNTTAINEAMDCLEIALKEYQILQNKSAKNAILA